MAASFGCDPVMAAKVARALAEIHIDMDSLGTLFDHFDGVTGSTRVESALDEFFAESSDNRSRMGKLLERASGLLRGLAEGTAAVDADLAKALAPSKGTASPSSTGSRPTSRAVAR